MWLGIKRKILLARKALLVLMARKALLAYAESQQQPVDPKLDAATAARSLADHLNA